MSIMNLSILKISNLCLIAFALAVLFTACEKENYDIIEEEVIGTIDLVMAITIGNVTTEYNAYATFCEGADGTIFLNVSNNPALLDTAILVDDFQLNDFLLYYVDDGMEVASIGGAALEENLGGIPFTYVVLDASAAIITITEANDQFVQGTMTGVFELLSGGQVDYSVEFTAEVVGVSTFCD